MVSNWLADVFVATMLVLPLSSSCPYLGANPVFVVWILYSDTQSEEVPTTEWHLFNKRLSKRNLGVWSAVHSLYKLNILEPKYEKGI